MKIALTENRYQHLGSVYRLIEQFELISRTDLAKISGLAPASMTALTKLLIEHKFILERTSQNLTSRGRPAVGLSLSPFYWTLLCFTLSSRKLTISLCRLNGSEIARQEYALSREKYAFLDKFVIQSLNQFVHQHAIYIPKLLAISVSVLGKIDCIGNVIQLGSETIHAELKQVLSTLFSCPILINEHFMLWFMAESSVGSLISDNDVIYLQLDTDINLSVLLQGKIFQQSEHKRMNVDKMLMPKFALSDEMAEGINETERYQLRNQVTFKPLAKMIDRYLPNDFIVLQDKINHFCIAITQHDPKAMQLLEHITDNLAYVLMNLINLFSTTKIMFNSPLQQIKQPLFEQLEKKLYRNLLLDDLKIDLVTSQYHWDDAQIPATAAKLALYNGELFKEMIML